MNDASNPRSPGGGRPAVDLDELERQLRQMAAARPAPAADPLSDLSRIIDRSDPVRAALRGTLPEERPVPRAPEPMRQITPEPQFEPSPTPTARAPEPEPQPAAPPLASARPSLDEERDRLVRAAQDDAVAALERAFARELLTPPQETVPARAPVPTPAMLPARDALEAFLRREPSAAADRPAPVAPAPDLQAHTPVQPASDGYAELREPEPAAEAYAPAVRTSVEQGEHGWENPAPDAEPYQEREPDILPLSRRRSGRGAMIAASMLGVGVLGLLLAFAFRSGEPSEPSGQPPLVRADNSPAKVAPANPGGLVIPNQNKQIYEPAQGAAPGSSNVVTTMEQPVDLNQVVRSQPARVVLPGPGGPGADAPAGAPDETAQQPANPVNALLGEPRRVKTVAVRPDGTIIGSDQQASLVAPVPAAPRVPLSPQPVPQAAPQSATPAPADTARASGQTGGNLSALATAASAPLSIAPAGADAEKNQQRVANPPPLRSAQAATPPAQAVPAPAPARVAAAPATATAPAPAASGGGFTVQLAAPGSEQEARSTYAALQRRFPDLGGYQPIVRRAEVGNRTLYRLRVGPMDRAGAVALCERLKAGGGQCFVAANN